MNPKWVKLQRFGSEVELLEALFDAKSKPSPDELATSCRDELRANFGEILGILSFDFEVGYPGDDATSEDTKSTLDLQQTVER